MIADLLAVLRYEPLNKRALAEKLGTTPREIELAVNAARLEGHAICSGSEGYFLGNAEQVRACAERLRSRALRQMATAAALADTAERMAAGPLLLWAAA